MGGILDGFFNRIFKTGVSADEADGESEDVLELPAAAIRFVGATIERVAGKNRIDVTFAGGEGGGPSLSDATPAAIGTAGPGNATTASRGNHVHAHGDQAGGSLHAAAIASGAAGFMSGADKAKLDGVASGATANVGTVTSVSGSGGISVATGTTTPAISIADGALALAKLANLAALRVLGSIAGGAPAELTPTQVTASLVEDATGSLPGRLSAAFWTLLNAATAAATANTLAKRDSNGDVSVRRLGVTDQINASSSLTVNAASSLIMSAPDVTIYAAVGGIGETCNGNYVRVAGGFSRCSSYQNIWEICTYGGSTRRYAMLTPTEQTTNSTSDAVPTGFQIVPSVRGARYLLRLSARIGDDHATWAFAFSARLVSGVAVLTAGAPPLPLFESTPALAAFQASVAANAGAIDIHVQPTTASSVTWTPTIEEC